MKIKARRTSLIAINQEGLRHWIPITLILFLAATLYFYQLGTESLWMDEILSIQAAQKNIFSLSLNRPLYFVLLRFWMQFSTDEAWLRGLSVIFGLGSILLIYLLGCRLSSRKTGLIAALLLTLSPLAIYHSQEVRMYMLSTCLGLGGTLSLTYVLAPTNRIIASINCWVWVGLRFLAVLTTPINILLLLPDFVLLGSRFRQQLRRLWLFKKWFWLAGILIIPAILTLHDVVPPLLVFLQTSTRSLPLPGIVHFVQGLAKFTVWPLPFKTYFEAAWLNEHFYNFYAVILVLMLVYLLVIALFDRHYSVKLFWAAAWGLFPVAVLFLISQVFPFLWYRERYLLFAAPYILILLAEAMVRIWSRRRAVAILVIVIYVIALSSTLVPYYTVQYHEDWRGLAHTISINEESKDAIVLFPTSYQKILEYYYRGSAYFYDSPEEKIIKAIDKPSAIQIINNLLSFNSRLWIIFIGGKHSVYNDSYYLIQTVLKEQFNVEKHQSFSSEDKSIDLFLVK